MQTVQRVQTERENLLRRELGVRQLAAVIFNYIVGSGIFVLPAVVAAQLGPAAILSYVVCGVVMALSVACFAEAGSRVSASGGPYAYIEVAMGPLAGFLAGVLNVLSALAAAAAVASVFAGSVSAFFDTSSPLLSSALIAVVLVSVGAINIHGVTSGARLVEVTALAKLVPLVVFVIVGAAFVEPANLRWQSTPSLSLVLQSAGTLIFAFLGIEGALQPSGEVRAPERTVPRAAFLALIGVVVLYLSVQAVGQGLLGEMLSQNRVTPLADAAATVAGPAGRGFMLTGAAISMFGFLCGSVLAGPRSLFAFAKDGVLPRMLSVVHPTRHTPHAAIGAYVAIALALSLSGSFEGLLVLANVSALVVYLGVAVAVWQLRRLDVRMHGAPFVLPGGPIIPALTCLSIGAVIVSTATWVEVAAVAATSLLATVVYWLRRTGIA